MLRGIVDQQDQEDVLVAMILLFNEMLIEVGKDYPNVYHIDCRGAVPRNGWYNELHPESDHFEKIAHAFSLCIDDQHDKEKVYKVNDVANTK